MSQKRSNTLANVSFLRQKNQLTSHKSHLSDRADNPPYIVYALPFAPERCNNVSEVEKDKPDSFNDHATQDGILPALPSHSKNIKLPITHCREESWQVWIPRVKLLRKIQRK